MIVDKHKPQVQEEEHAVASRAVNSETTNREEELYRINALAEVYKVVKNILGDLKLDENDPNSPPLFRTIKLNHGQINRLKNNKWNKEYAIAFPAVFLHFINVYYLVQQSRIGEGRATMRIQYVLNRLNLDDAGYELEGYDIFQRINVALQDRKSEFPSDLIQRFQLGYFDQFESFDDGLQPFWIDYEVWFYEYSSYRYKNYVERTVVVPPFTTEADKTTEEEGSSGNTETPDHEEVNDEAADFQIPD